ncbi:MAG TPA: substrate-binding domain-containing protein [Candidatus Acidoferrum sp.]|nr:substrate-binding domain-containing protein [Candidatus Acidoferrum sp.]
MSKLRFLFSLITKENDYQVEQAAAALATAKEIGVDAAIVYADNDPITQSTQVLKAIQSGPSERPNGIVIEPLGATAFPQAAQAAASAGIGWAVLSRRADYAREMGKSARTPVFSVSVDQVEVGRIQARQVMALLPRGGSVLFIQGPSVSSVSKERHDGLMEMLPGNVHLSSIRGRWTEESAYQSVISWFKLMTAQKARIDLVLAQNDVMGMGARKAIEDTVTGPDRDDWLDIPITGVDGVLKTGQAWVTSGKLAATVIVPASSGKALRLMAEAIWKGSGLAEHIFTSPTAFPEIAKLTPNTPKE